MTLKSIFLSGCLILVMAGLVLVPDVLLQMNASSPFKTATYQNTEPDQTIDSKRKTVAETADPDALQAVSKTCRGTGHDSGIVIKTDGQQIYGNKKNGDAREQIAYRLSPGFEDSVSAASHGTLWTQDKARWYAPHPGFFGIETLSLKDGTGLSLFVGPPQGQGLKDVIATGETGRDSVPRQKGIRSMGTTIEYFNPGDDAPLNESFHYNAKLAAIEKLEFDHFTPANAMKWPLLGHVDPARPYEWIYNWSKANRIANEIRLRKSTINLHTLIWDIRHGIPQHLWNMDRDGVLTRTILRRKMRNHIHAVIGRYGDIIDRIDVVNEDIFKEGGDYLFGRKKYLGDGYIGFAFDETQKAIKAYNQHNKTSIDPELMINDYNVLFSYTDPDGDNKSDQYFKRIARLIKQGVKIDAVGMQAHIRMDELSRALDKDDNGLSGEEIYSGIEDNLKRFSDLGVSLMITELDVEEAWGPKNSRGDSDFRLVYEVIGALAHDLPELTDVTLWGSSDATMRMVLDKYEDDPGLYDKNYQRKPEYYAFLQGLTGNSDYNLPPRNKKSSSGLSDCDTQAGLQR